MRKNRSWLMGLGIGIILGASMLQLINAAKDRSDNMPPTREQLQQEAKDAGFAVYPADEKLYTEEELQKKLDEATQAKPKPEAQPSDDAAPQAEASSSPSAESSPRPSGEAPATESAGEPANVDSRDEPVTLYVRPNMSLQQVAEELEKLGIVADADAFVKTAKPISKRLDPGTATFAPGMTDEDIMSELTRRKP